MTTLNVHSPQASESLDRLVERAGELYSLPAVTIEVLELTSNPQVNVQQLKECIEKDPALTAKILRVVNSSVFGLSSNVSNLNQAIALLGCRPLKLLVLGFRLPQGLFQGVTGAMLKRYWHHALAKAVAARKIAQRLSGIPADEAFIAGLLQDIGILVMLQGVGDAYVRFLDKVVEEKADLISMQREALGFDHTQISSCMFERWGLPDLIVESVRMPGGEENAYTSDESATLASVVELADVLSTMLVDDRPELWSRLEQLGASAGGITSDQLRELGGELQERVDLLAEALRIELPNDRDYAATMSRAYAQLSEVATSAAADMARASKEPAQGRWRESVSLEEAVARFEFHTAPIAGNIATGETETELQPQHDDGHKHSTSDTEVIASDVTQRGVLGRQQLLNHLSAAVAACRRRRCPVSLLMIECGSEDTGGSTVKEALDPLERLVSQAVGEFDHDDYRLLKLSPGELAVILPDCDRRQAVETANQLMADVYEFACALGDPPPEAIQLGVGVSSVAQVAKNFPADRLVEGASRCLFGARAAGGSSVKSIEIY